MEKPRSEAVSSGQGQRGAGSDGAEDGPLWGPAPGGGGGSGGWGRGGQGSSRLGSQLPARPGPRRSPAAKAEGQSKTLELSGQGELSFCSA